jgi:hypothetical protein
VAKSRFSFLAKFLAGVTLNEADKGDRTTEPEVSSVLSVRSEGVSRVQEIEETLIKDKNPQKMLRIEADITDKTIPCMVYVLAGRALGRKPGMPGLSGREDARRTVPCQNRGGIVFIPDLNGRRLCAICD